MESPRNRREANDSYCGVDRGGRVWLKPTTLVGFCLLAGLCRLLTWLPRDLPRIKLHSLTTGELSPTRDKPWEGEREMSTTDIGVKETATESLPELVAGLAVIILTILGLAGVNPAFLVEIATIVFGVGLLLYGSATLSQFSRVLAEYRGAGGAAGIASGWSIILLAGAAGIVLGILALLGVSSIQLVAIAVIAFGAALLISSNASMRLRVLLGTPANTDPAIERLVRDAASDTAGLQTMTGLAAIVLGILALSGFAPTILVLIALLGLGCFASLTSAFIAGTFARAFQVAPRT
jgi:hypothetical protein